MINYKYSEERILDELKEYIDKTYSQHYSQGSIQTTEFIIDQQKSVDFLLGNVIKYVSRFGKKQGYNRGDIMKAIHYCIIALYYSSLLSKDEDSESLRQE